MSVNQALCVSRSSLCPVPEQVAFMWRNMNESLSIISAMFSEHESMWFGLPVSSSRFNKLEKWGWT